MDLGTGIAAVDQLLRGSGRVSGALSGTPDGLPEIRDARLSYPNLSASADRRGDTLSFDARLRDIGLFTPEFSGPLDATGTLVTAGEDLRLDVAARGPGGIAAEARGTVGAGGRLDLTASGQLPLGLANPFIEPRRLRGTADFNLSVNGPAALSSVSGQVRLAEARLAAPTLTLALENLGGRIDLASGTARIDLGAEASTGGRIAVSGPVGLSAPFRADLALRLDGLILREPALYETTVDGEVTLSGPLAGGATIGGRLRLGETEIQIPSTGVGALGPLPDVTHVNAPGPVRLTLDRADLPLRGGAAGTDTGAGSGPVYGLDLVVRAPNRIFVRGRGLDAELGGQLRLTGTTRQVQPIGRFDLIRGRLDILGQRFALTEGFAQLQGDFDPFLRLVAATETRDGTDVAIVVEGVATAPEIRFESSPALPQDEVLALLLFGRSVSEISPLQAVQLASAVGTLAGRGDGGALGTLRESFGLADLDVTSDEEGNVGVRAGAYLSENVYTDVTVSNGGSTEINLNLDLTRDITIKGTAGSDGDTSIGIFFERDY